MGMLGGKRGKWKDAARPKGGSTDLALLGRAGQLRVRVPRMP